jgi:hypothetical protein
MKRKKRQPTLDDILEEFKAPLGRIFARLPPPEKLTYECLTILFDDMRGDDPVLEYLIPRLKDPSFAPSLLFLSDQALIGTLTWAVAPPDHPLRRVYSDEELYEKHKYAYKQIFRLGASHELTFAKSVQELIGDNYT